MAWKSFALPSLPQQGKKSHVATAVALEVSAALKRAQTLAGLSLSRCLGSAAARSHSAKGSSGHPAPAMSCSGPGKAGQGTTPPRSRRFQPRDYFSDSELCFPAGPAMPAPGGLGASGCPPSPAQVRSTSKTRPRQGLLMPCLLTPTVLPQEEDKPPFT